MSIELVVHNNPMQAVASLATTVQASVRSRRGLFAQASTLRTGPPAFVDIPDDNLYTICSFLDLRDFNRLLLTCKREHEVWDDSEVWTRLLRRDFPDVGTQLDIPARLANSISRVASRLWATDVIAKSGIADAKQLYRDRLEAHRRTINTKVEERQQHKHDELVEHQSNIVRVVLDILSYICGIGAPCAMLALWLLLVMLELNGNIDVAWSLVWIPVWLLAGKMQSLTPAFCSPSMHASLIAGIPTLNCIVHLALVFGARGNVPASMWRNQDASNSNISIVGITMWITSRSRTLTATLCRAFYFLTMLALLFVIFPAFVLARITGEISWSWGFVFIPVWVVFAGWMCVPWVITGVVTTRLKKHIFGWSMFVWLPLLIVSFMVPARLNGSDIRLSAIFIPFWILDGVMGLAWLSLFVLLCVGNERRLVFLLLLGLSTFLGVGVTFTTLASASDNEGSSIDVIGFMLPMVVSISVLAVAACVVAVRSLKSDRDARFPNAWQYVCSCSCCARCCRAPPTPILPGAA